MTERRPLLLGHRGAGREAAENTLTAFDLALAHGCHGFELDVRCTSDGHALLCHDPQIAGVAVANSTYRNIVQRRSAQATSAAEKDCDRLPCLEDVLERYAGRCFLDIELKVEGLESVLAKLLKRCDSNKVMVSSFLPEVLHNMRRLSPNVQLGWICDERKLLPSWIQLPCDVVVAHHELTDQDLIEQVHAAGKKIFVWTVNARNDVLLFARLGADAIISDDTRMLAACFP